MESAAGSTWNPLRAALGDDGRLSTSKFQFLVWSVAVLFVAIADGLTSYGTPNPAAGFSMNLLVVMGLSFGTALGAQGITVSYLAKSTANVKASPTGGSRIVLRDLVVGDDGSLDLGKLQMMAWTAVGIGSFLYAFLANATNYGMCLVNGPDHTTLCFPDISPTFMVLMGLSQGTYLGGKFIASNAMPTITSAAAALQTLNGGATVLDIVVNGTNLTSGNITVNGVAAPGAVWSGTSMTLSIANPVGADVVVVGDSVSIAGDVANVCFAPISVTVAAARTI